MKTGYILLIVVPLILIIIQKYVAVKSKKNFLDEKNTELSKSKDAKNIKFKDEDNVLTDEDINEVRYKEIQEDKYINETMMQYFEWYYPCDFSLWNKLKNEAVNLKKVGITALWLPPAYKAAKGKNDVGYGAYDLYDLGEFDQKGTISTKYGSKKEYLDAINEAHNNGIKVYGDVVFNHKAGADDSEIIYAREVDCNNRNNIISDVKTIKAHTIFNFPGRNGKYSSYKWNSKDFSGVDRDELNHVRGIFKLEGKEWEREVDNENGNYDFLMCANVDMNNENVVNELKSWGRWYLGETNVDGFRLDAIKHIKFDFFKEWLNDIRQYSNKELFAVGEYWSGDVNKLNYYFEKCGKSMSLFDAPLHYNFYNASNSYGNFDMRRIKDRTFLSAHPDKCVTFVDNHDTQLGQALQSWVQDWFKPSAYTFILTRSEGYPCIFFGDYYGIPNNNFKGLKEKLDVILFVRKKYAYGIQHDYIDNPDVIGWTREGKDDIKDSGLAAVITNRIGGKKKMFVGIAHKGEEWMDITRNINYNIIIDDSGFGVFEVLNGSYSIWVKK